MDLFFLFSTNAIEVGLLFFLKSYNTKPAMKSERVKIQSLVYFMSIG